jgi:hypothetical protein
MPPASLCCYWSSQNQSPDLKASFLIAEGGAKLVFSDRKRFLVWRINIERDRR